MAAEIVWYCAAGAAATYIFLQALLHLTQDPQEPPTLATSIPFLSPLLGLGFRKTTFFHNMRDHYGLPIYTLRMPGSRMYVINSVSLITPLQRQIRTIAFHPIEHQAAVKVMGLTKAGGDILGTGFSEDDSYLGTFVKAIHPALSPGAGLDELNRSILGLITASLDSYKTEVTTDLFRWVRHEMVMATTDATYGPYNIFRTNPKTEEAWYKFEPGIMALMTSPYPSILARKSYLARESLVPDLMEYFGKERHKQGSLLVQCRYNHNISHGLNLEDVARTEIGQISASITNTIAAAFWFVYHIVSDPVVLQDCLQEASRLVSEDESAGSGARVRRLDLQDVKTSCPILLSTWQEALRYRHIGIQARVVMEDHMLDGRHLLKKGGTVMVANSVLHSDESIWGTTVNTFDHRRFLKAGSGKRVNPVAFRGFGGGSTLCPGRHFATTEVLSFAAQLILRFDVKPVGGRWVDPPAEIPMTAAFPAPKKSVPVVISPKGDEKWHVTLSGSTKAVMMITEEL